MRTKRDVPFALLAFAVLWSCASSDAWLGDVPKGPPQLVSPDASTDLEGGADVSLSALMCVASECPEPYTTCPSTFGPTYKCAVDLRRDNDNCGTCGKACQKFEPIHMNSRCIDGKCELECLSVPRYVFPDSEAPTNYKNCNGLYDDGCESDLFTDRANCGACGNECAGDLPCINGQCGCPTGLTECSGFCVDVSNNDRFCGPLCTQCDFPAAPCDPMPANAGYGCVGNACEKLKCEDKFGDCNSDLGLECASDGCETSFLDPNNCGACLNVCGANEECREENGIIGCRPRCADLGRSLCPDGNCVDILNDPDNCGGCLLRCDFAGPHQQRSCSKGACVVACAEGFGDCNGDPTDGCETNLSAHPSNCGACGVTCDLARGQPCVEGKCLVRPCDGPEAK